MIEPLQAPLGISFVIKIVLKRIMNKIIDKIKYFINKNIYKNCKYEYRKIENNKLNEYLYKKRSYKEIEIKTEYSLYDYLSKNTI